MTCDENCELYMKHGYIQECIDCCCELMSCKDVVTDTCQCNFCDVPYIILEDIKCRHVANLDWWYDEGYYEKDKKYYKRKFEKVLGELSKCYARIAELKQENKELDDENASLLASKIEMLEQMQELEKKFDLVGELAKYYGAKKC